MNDTIPLTMDMDYDEYEARFNDSPNPAKSRADLILTEAEEQLNVNELKFDKVKERMKYLKNLYETCGTIPSELSDITETNDFEINKIVSPQEIILNSTFVDDDKTEVRLASGDSRYYDFITETQRSLDETERLKLSARSHAPTPGLDIFPDIQDENSSDPDTENSIFEEARSGDKNFDDAEQSKNILNDDELDATTLSRIRRENEIGKILSSQQHPYQINLVEYSKNIEDEWEEEELRQAKASMSENQQIQPSDRPETAEKRDFTKQELFLNISGSVESVQTTKNKKSRSEKHRKAIGSATSTNRKSGIKQVYENIGATAKIKRKRRRIKATNSRSTTATRDASVVETRKEAKKKKQKVNTTILISKSSNHRHEIATNIQRSLSEMVEIYHNNALKSGSISVVSSKHSRLEQRNRSAVGTKNCERRSATKNNRGSFESRDNARRNGDDIEERGSKKQQKNSQRIGVEGNRDQEKNYEQNLPEVADFRSGEPIGAKIIFKPEPSKVQSDEKTIEEYNAYEAHRQTPNNLFSCYDSLAIRNYELPTVASKMKRVNRSYFNRFNFRNIPFVVGTSVTPSYNLGLNIQETLSLIKTRQMMPGGATPFLISRVSKGMRPVSTLLGCSRDQDETPNEETSLSFGITSDALCNIYPRRLTTGNNNIAPNSVQLGTLSLQTPRLSCAPNTETFYEARKNCGNTMLEDAMTKKRQDRSIRSSMKFDRQNNLEARPELTQSTLLRQRQEELKSGDSQSTKWSSAPRAKGIREVLINFHDQFQAMQLKYEKLQNQAEKSSDESLRKEMSALEKELNAKEEEINAVVSLYQEVMALKQQMKMLHERNSLVCVTTECPGSQMQTEISARAYTANPVRLINVCGRNRSMNSRGPSTSTRLAGLLRQIKTFQKQLKSSS